MALNMFDYFVLHTSCFDGKSCMALRAIEMKLFYIDFEVSITSSRKKANKQ